MARSKAVEPAPTLWVYHGVDRVYAQPAMEVRDGDVVEMLEPPDTVYWTPAEAGAEVTLTPGAHRIWTPEELTHQTEDGVWAPALKEHWQANDEAVGAALAERAQQEVSTDAV